MKTVDVNSGSHTRKGAKKMYVKPEIKEVWNENIGMTGAYLLEM